MNKIKILLICLAALVFITSCSDDTPAPDLDRTVMLSTVKTAVTNGIGTFDVTVSDGDVDLKLVLVSPDTDLTTGTYLVNRDLPVAYSVTVGKDNSFWLDQDGVLHVIASGKVTVISEGETAKLSGTLLDQKGDKLSFEAGSISFSPISSERIQLTKVLLASYSSNYGNGHYRVILANEDQTIATTLNFYNVLTENPDRPVIPNDNYEGVNSGIVGGLYLDVSSWLDAASNTTHKLSGASLKVESLLGITSIEGTLTNITGETVSISFSGVLRFNANLGDQDMFTTFSTQWTMGADNWLSYDRNAQEWVVLDDHAGTNKTMRWIGIPDYSLFYATGLWRDDSSGMYVRVNSNGQFYIPIGVNNPVMFLSLMSGDFVLFPTLYNPVTGNFLSTGSIMLELSEDESTFTVQQSVINQDGNTYTFDYFGLIGYNISTGQYSFFTDWAFTELPTFTRDNTVVTRSGSMEREIPSEQELLKALSVTGNETPIIIKADNATFEDAVSVKSYSTNR